MRIAADSADLVVLIAVWCSVCMGILALIVALVLWFWSYLGRFFGDPPEQ